MMEALSESHEDIAKCKKLMANGKDPPPCKTSLVDGEPSSRRYLITSEPILVLFNIGIGLYDPTVSALTYHKVCQMRINDTYICDNLHNESYKAHEDLVQTESAYWFIYQQLCFELPAVFLSFFYGSLGDHVSRKKALILPVLGNAFAMIAYLLCSIYRDSHVGYLLIGKLISGIFGGWISCLLACYSYISEVSADDRRTLRISIGEGLESVSLASALFLSGILLDQTSYPVVFSVALLAYVIGVLYCLVIVVDTPRQLAQTHTVASVFQSMFHWRRVKDALTCVFRKRENRGRKRLLVLLMSLFFGMVSYYAVPSVSFLFLKRQPLSWTQSRFGVYLSLNRMMSGLFSLSVIPVTKHFTHMPDTILLLLGLLSAAASEFYFSFCVTSWMVYLVPVIGLVAQVKYTVFRSLLSQLVETDELGRMFATLGCLQSLTGLIGTSLYNSIYPATLDFWPGFTFMVGAVMALVPISLTIWMHVDFQRYGLHRSTVDIIEPSMAEKLEMAPLLSESDSAEIDTSEEPHLKNGHSEYEKLGTEIH